MLGQLSSLIGKNNKLFVFIVKLLFFVLQY